MSVCVCFLITEAGYLPQEGALESEYEGVNAGKGITNFLQKFYIYIYLLLHLFTLLIKEHFKCESSALVGQLCKWITG